MTRGPVPKDAASRQRRNKASTKAVLSAVVDHDIPPMPPAEDWLPSVFGDQGQSDDADASKAYEMLTQWSPAVIRWWESIWSSPMSNEYHEADIHQLYLACFYLQQTLNPFAKITERLAAAKQHEAQVARFGLNPMSRRSLQWEIERSEEAMLKGKKRAAKDTEREEAKNEHMLGADPRDQADEDDQNPWDVTPVISA